MELTIREFNLNDIANIVDYFLDADSDYLKGMGADKTKLPERSVWIKNLIAEYHKPITEKTYYYIIWLVDNLPVGHSNVNNISFGASSTMHLHLWNTKQRKQGLGLHFLKLTIPQYFQQLQLKQLICEPYSKNIAPNKTLQKIGFKFIQTYETIPGPISFKQKVNRYELSKQKFKLLKLK